MKKLAMFFLLALLMFTMLFQTGCSSDTTTDDADAIVIGIEVTNLGNPPAGQIDTLSTGTSFTIEAQLTGLTSNYSQINFYLGDNSTPLDVSWNSAALRTLEVTQNLDATILQTISTVGLAVGDYDLRVEAVGTNFATDYVEIDIHLKEPTIDEPWIDLKIISPDTTEYAIGDIMNFVVEIQGNNTMFGFFDAYLVVDSSLESITSTVTTYDETISFNFDTTDLSVGYHTIKCQVTDRYGDVKEKIFNFDLYEYIPTFERVDDDKPTDIDHSDGAGYALKSIIQTHDNGYITVASDSTEGTRVVKYDLEGVKLWSENIPANIGIAEGVCEDRDYDGGIVIAGWRDNGTDKDTWVRKVSSNDGSLIWNKHYGLAGIDDGATIIKKSFDDGFIIGGYALNPLGTDSLFAEFVRTTWETGYDIRVIKIYSNGNSAGNESEKMWNDITGHGIYYNVDGVWYASDQWVKKMGDQYITDLFVTKYGSIMATGWQNFRLYDGAVIEEDMFFAEFSSWGGLNRTTTWSRMSARDNFYHGKASFFDYAVNTHWLNAKSLGGKYNAELSYGIVESYGGYNGEVVMVGETFQTDDFKSKLYDAWVVEYELDGDDDGALWEYAFGDAEKNEKAYGITQTKDDGYVITGYGTGTGTDKETWTYKLSKELFFVWSHKYDASGNDWGVKALQCRDGGYMTGGNVETGASVRARLIKRNKLGEENLK